MMQEKSIIEREEDANDKNHVFRRVADCGSIHRQHLQQQGGDDDFRSINDRDRRMCGGDGNRQIKQPHRKVELPQGPEHKNMLIGELYHGQI